jgi:hypothetical protein
LAYFLWVFVVVVVVVLASCASSVWLPLYGVVPFSASRSATSFPCMPAWEGTHCIVTYFKAVSCQRALLISKTVCFFGVFLEEIALINY